MSKKAVVDRSKALTVGGTPRDEASGVVQMPNQSEGLYIQELFLPIHGHVELRAEELAIIDHPAFQRLRRVRQLGLAHMVFPGATHTRFEHSVGAVYVAQLIIDHVNRNCDKRDKERSIWKLRRVNDATTQFIRLAALLHDVGHLPFGHTLEDELNHLRSHDGPERLGRVANVPYLQHEIDKHLAANAKKPAGGWTLANLLDQLYKPAANSLNITDFTPFEILTHIVCKVPKDPILKNTWEEQTNRLNGRIMLRVCQDVVGNTICADFLDYLHRDWYHLGKPLYFDKRLYQYMEIREPSGIEDGDNSPRFVINVGASEKVRHDALTDILSLLNERYKLAQTVLFHRTKLALTGLLDRCLLEISDLYKKAEFSAQRFIELAEQLLLGASDDGISLILEHLAQGGDGDGRARLSNAISKENAAIQGQFAHTEQPALIMQAEASATTPANSHASEAVIRGELGSQKELALRLINRLRDREVYSLVYKLRISDFTGPHTPENPTLKKLLRLYKEPQNRLDFLRGMEMLCDFPPGTFVMNCPSDAGMNAKVAKVSLFVEGDVTRFDVYEESQGDSSLTRGALKAQINRFYELWAANIYMDRRQWDNLSPGQQQHLKLILPNFFFPMEANADPKILRMQMEPSVDVLQRRASQSGTTDPMKESWRAFVFPGGLPFALEEIAE